MQKVEPLMIEAHGARIPALGFGTWNLRDKICVRAVQQAILLGYRHIDTAQIYENERQVGEGIHATGIKRREIFVTTKIWTTHFAPNDLERSVKDSLVRLRMSEVDLALLHWPNPHVPLNETLGALAHIREQGLTRHIGVSNFTVALMAEAVATCPAPLVCNQIEYHPFLDQTKVLNACKQHGMAVVAYSPLAQGKVRGNPVLAAIGAKHGVSETQIALRWLIQQGVGAIPRSAKVERMSENLAIFDFTLSDDDMNQISALRTKQGRVTQYSGAPVWDE